MAEVLCWTFARTPIATGGFGSVRLDPEEAGSSVHPHTCQSQRMLRLAQRLSLALRLSHTLCCRDVMRSSSSISAAHMSRARLSDACGPKTFCTGWNNYIRCTAPQVEKWATVYVPEDVVSPEVEKFWTEARPADIILCCPSVE